MSPDDIIRAWKDEDYRSSLSPDQRSQLPDHPASWVELNDSELQAATGGRPPGRVPKTFEFICPDRTLSDRYCATAHFFPTCNKLLCDRF